MADPHQIHRSLKPPNGCESLHLDDGSLNYGSVRENSNMSVYILDNVPLKRKSEHVACPLNQTVC